MRKYRFFIHYNKPASIKAAQPVMTVHFRNKCYLAHSLTCMPHTQMKINKTQPHVVMQGWAREITLGQTGKDITII
jgi:hypothetical protein